MVERRRILWLPVGAAWAALLGRVARAAPPRSPLSFEEFIATAEPLARERVRDATPQGQDAYVLSIAAAAVRLREVAPHPLFQFRKGIELAPIHKGAPFVVIEWRLAPNAVFEAHDHPNYSVCTVGLDGEAEVQHYELGAGNVVRHTRTAVIEKGRVDVLSPYRDNIHRFVAGPHGARGIDITTLHGSDVGFHFVELDAIPNVGATTKARLRKG